MVNVIGVRFQQNGKMYYFDAGAFTPSMGEFVVVDTDRGSDLGEVIMEVHPAEEGQYKAPLARMIRPATEQDIQKATDNRTREAEAYRICQQKIQEHHLEMKLVSVECMFDSSKILFYFTANGRVDFRSLVKDLASVFKTRIELRQIGVRDEARMLGGLGPCGRPICCGAFLTDFQPVSIKMAKEQSLSLNPTKISGVCGRLMCCLKYEQEHYEQTRKKMPRLGKEVVTPEGNGIVTELNIVKETVSVRITNGDESEIRQFPMDQVSRVSPRSGERELRPDIGMEAASTSSAEKEGEEREQENLAAISEDDVLDPVAPTYAELEARENNLPFSQMPEAKKDQRKGPRNSSRRAKERPAGKERPDPNEFEEEKNHREESGSKSADRKSSRVLGHPVQRANTSKVQEERKKPARFSTEDAPIPSMPEKTAAVPQPVMRKNKKSSDWADALQKALQAADSSTDSAADAAADPADHS